MKLYKLFSLTATFIFAVVGLVFLFFPDSPLIFFNNISFSFGLPKSPVQGFNFYLILATAYMYIVTLLAFMMYRHPMQNIYPSLLAQAKIVSSILSIYLFFKYQPYLIFFANFVVDGAIGITVLFLMKMKK